MSSTAGESVLFCPSISDKGSISCALMDNAERCFERLEVLLVKSQPEVFEGSPICT